MGVFDVTVTPRLAKLFGLVLNRVSICEKHIGKIHKHQKKMDRVVVGKILPTALCDLCRTGGANF